MKIWTFNAFTNGVGQPFTGNPGAVLLVDQFPKEHVMQGIAADIALSNTGFIKQLAEREYQIFWYSPKAPAPLCGHVTLGATAALHDEEICNGPIVYHSISGTLQAEVTNDWVQLNFPCYPPQPITINQAIADALGMWQHEVQFCGVGENILLVELADAQSVRSFIPNHPLIAALPYRAIIITAAALDYDFITRYFAPKVMIPEDPVCGSSFSRLIPYWSQRLNKQHLVAYHASSRGGVVRGQLLTNRVRIAGQVMITMRGAYQLP